MVLVVSPILHASLIYRGAAEKLRSIPSQLVLVNDPDRHEHVGVACPTQCELAA